jgi:hypothetical protein
MIRGMAEAAGPIIRLHPAEVISRAMELAEEKCPTCLSGLLRAECQIMPLWSTRCVPDVPVTAA